MSGMTREEARAKCVSGWNIRCNHCGSYGAEWLYGERPGWGALALCSECKAEYYKRKAAVDAMRAVKYEQYPGWETC